MSATIVDSLKALITKLGGAIAQEETIVESLKGVYVALGGEDDVQNNNTVVEMLDKITEVAEGGGDYDFTGVCTGESGSLTGVMVPELIIRDTYNRIMSYSFSGVPVKKIISNSIMYVESNGFREAKLLEEIVFKNTNVISLSSSVFGSVSTLKKITFYNITPPTVNENTFSNFPSSARIYVPSEAVDAYKSAWSSWSGAESKILAIPEE